MKGPLMRRVGTSYAASPLAGICGSRTRRWPRSFERTLCFAFPSPFNGLTDGGAPGQIAAGARRIGEGWSASEAKLRKS